MSARKRIIFRGHVQGVGFRATCHSIASGRQVGGFVRNLASGDVELVLEGETRDVQCVLAEVLERMETYIRGSTVIDEPPQGEQQFRIAR